MKTNERQEQRAQEQKHRETMKKSIKQNIGQTSFTPPGSSGGWRSIGEGRIHGGMGGIV